MPREEDLRLRARVERLKEICDIYRDASLQSHIGHWDETGGGGSGCPQCIRASELRKRADALRAAVEEE